MYLALSAVPRSLLPVDTTPGTGAQAATRISLVAVTESVIFVFTTRMHVVSRVLSLTFPRVREEGQAVGSSTSSGTLSYQGISSYKVRCQKVLRRKSGPDVWCRRLKKQVYSLERKAGGWKA
jgi:hypothetical protein